SAAEAPKDAGRREADLPRIDLARLDRPRPESGVGHRDLFDFAAPPPTPPPPPHPTPPPPGETPPPVTRPHPAPAAHAQRSAGGGDPPSGDRSHSAASSPPQHQVHWRFRREEGAQGRGIDDGPQGGAHGPG